MDGCTEMDECIFTERQLSLKSLETAGSWAVEGVAGGGGVRCVETIQVTPERGPDLLFPYTPASLRTSHSDSFCPRAPPPSSAYCSCAIEAGGRGN